MNTHLNGGGEPSWNLAGIVGRLGSRHLSNPLPWSHNPPHSMWLTLCQPPALFPKHFIHSQDGGYNQGRGGILIWGDGFQMGTHLNTGYHCQHHDMTPPHSNPHSVYCIYFSHGIIWLKLTFGDRYPGLGPSITVPSPKSVKFFFIFNRKLCPSHYNQRLFPRINNL